MANTAGGQDALASYVVNQSVANSAFGHDALQASTTGSHNSAFGNASLLANTTGTSNAAFGSEALMSNTTGLSNSAFGYYALPLTTTSQSNAAFGASALQSLQTGDDNTAVGTAALLYLTTGTMNVAVGSGAGYNVTTGSNNIHIGNQGTATDSGTIKIGTTQTSAYLAGIVGNDLSATGTPVFVDSSGKLGTGSAGGSGADPRFGKNTGYAAAGQGQTCTLGQVMLTAGYVATGLPAAGQILPIAQYTALFSLLGTLYGGDGITNFALPDLRGVAPNGLTYSICMAGVYPARQ
ncbi:MAG TPA: phage tail protein [Anaeromyxobacteraceae bacterium]|nr:phage tail protein [Anaeromyxobacteraceae bacterium]